MKPMPFAMPEGYIDAIEKDLTEFRQELWFVFKNCKLLVHLDSLQPFQPSGVLLYHSLYVGTFSEFHIHAAELASDHLPDGSILLDLQKLYGKIDDALFALAGRSSQLISWNSTHQFCGRCGSKTVEKIDVRSRECLSCNLVVFPKICPVIIVLIRKQDEILLAKGVHFSGGFYSAIAGFVDAGETLEQCVKREVFEEVGLLVDNIQYFASQSWPFPNSLMIAFTCDWKACEIIIDPSEIADARWFRKDNLPPLPPQYSIARILIDFVLDML